MRRFKPTFSSPWPARPPGVAKSACAWIRVYMIKWDLRRKFQARLVFHIKICKLCTSIFAQTKTASRSWSVTSRPLHGGVHSGLPNKNGCGTKNCAYIASRTWPNNKVLQHQVFAQICPALQPWSGDLFFLRPR